MYTTKQQFTLKNSNGCRIRVTNQKKDSDALQHELSGNDAKKLVITRNTKYLNKQSIKY